MLRYLVQTVQSLLATGTLAALIFAGIAGGGEAAREARRRALWGCAAGAAAALALAVMRRTTALVSRGMVNLWVLAFAAALGVLYIVLLWGAAGKKRGDGGLSPAEALPNWTRAFLLLALMLYALPTIFLYPTEFALPGESVFTTDSLFKFIGFAAGLLAAGGTALALYKAASALPGAWLRAFLTAALLVNICSQLASIAQFLLARRIIPMIRWLFRVIVAASNYNMVLIYTLMGIGLAAAAVVFGRTFGPVPPLGNPAERRKFRFRRLVNRRACAAAAAGFALSVFLFTFVKDYIERGVELSPAEPMTLSGGEILIPAAQVEDGHLHRFVYTAEDGTEVRFIVIKKSAAAYGVGLDACDICGPTGYYERKDEVICKLCDVVMNKSTIGFKGGCNPVPLAYTMRSGIMVIEAAGLENERGRFK